MCKRSATANRMLLLGFAPSVIVAMLVGLVTSLSAHNGRGLDSPVGDKTDHEIRVDRPVQDGEATEDQSGDNDSNESDRERHFVANVLPILQTKCYSCHGDDPDDLRGNLDMRSRSGNLIGGDSGLPAIEPGSAAESPLMQAVGRESADWPAMPPKESDQLTGEQIEHLGEWIDDGAVWPSEQVIAEMIALLESEWDAADGVPVETSGGLSDEWTRRRYKPEQLWAYQPIQVDSKRVQQADQHPVDLFINDRLEQVGLAPARRADRLTLIRRATFDLTGLPPTSDEIAQFLGDESNDEVAFEKVIDRLLRSQHYGEQWGRHWLDVVRYADSSGFANDYERGNAWRYRDYVVRSFNQDRAYDQFVREQVAGDDIDPSDAEMRVAVGMLRMGPWELTGMEVAKVARQRFLDDVTDSVGQVFLAHMMQCARCHDHKFDPIPTRDYYSLQSFFATTQLAERYAPFLANENLAGFDESRFLERRRDHYRTTLAELSQKVTLETARDWYRDEGLDATYFEAAVAELSEAAEQPSSISFSRVRAKLAADGVPPNLIPPKNVGFEPADYGLERVARKGLERLGWQMERYQPFALSVYSGRTPRRNSVTTPQRIPESPQTNGVLETVSILTGGDPFAPSIEVVAAPLSAVGSLSTMSDDETESDTTPMFSGRRLQLADWMVDPANPLTSRVIANRVWQWHFGAAIAGNPNNFGATGQTPTHPALLDWLAAELMENGWSLKHLHRTIMTSDAYCRASTHDDASQLDALDANRELYAIFQPRRLDAEELRDAMLFASGELNLTVGGIPARPEMNLEAALQPRMVMGSFAEAWQPSPLPEQRHRRSLYALKIRGLRDPFFEVFNAPTVDSSCEARESSTVTPQVFAMFNSDLSFDRALAMANRLLTGAEADEEVIRQAFLLAYGRPANEREVETCLAHWAAMTARHQELSFSAPEYPLEVTRTAAEENTGVKFEYVEPLEFYAEFVPDLKPSDASPRLRGLAEVCLVLLNSNEFAYVY